MASLRIVLLFSMVFSAFAPMASAQTGTDAIEKRIAAQGFEILYSETTWLGRLRILSVRNDLLREVVIGPGTGEIMRDVVYEIPGLSTQIAAARNGNPGKRVVNLEAFGGPDEVTIDADEPVAVRTVPLPYAREVLEPVPSLEVSESADG